MERAFRRLEQSIDPPELVRWRGHQVLWYGTQSIEQALIQKLARVISGLNAADALLEKGFVQEQGIIHRTLDEINEDIVFLAAARTSGSVTSLHERYLRAFFQDPFPEDGEPEAEAKKPVTPTRTKIRAYIQRVRGAGVEPSADVPAASQNNLDLCGGRPPRFHLRGMQGTPRIGEHAADAWNHLYRGFGSVLVAAKAFGDQALVDALAIELEKLNGRMGVKPPPAR